MHLPDFTVTFRRLPVTSSNCKLALAYTLFPRALSPLVIINLAEMHRCAAARITPSAFSALLLRNTHTHNRSIYCAYFGRTSQRVSHNMRSERATRAPFIPADLPTNKRKRMRNTYLKRLEAATSLQRHENVLLFPAARKPSAGSPPLPATK